MFPLTPILTSLFLPLNALASLPSPCPSAIGPHGIHVRLPPALTLNPASPPWISPPFGWYFKLWTMLLASNPQYLSFRNLQYDPTPLDSKRPDGEVNDLTSFQLPGNKTVYTSYGIDTPSTRPDYTAVLDYVGTGILSNATSQYSILAWGCDARSTPYYVSYSSAAAASQTPAGVDVFSTDAAGIDAGTREALVRALAELPSEEIRGLVEGLVEVVRDGGREGMGRVTCDEECKTNRNLIPILA